MDPMEDLKELATRIASEIINDGHQQRLCVERKKLEHILIWDSQAPNPGATFFHKIMQDTNTIINWPSILTIRKTTEDLYITLSGRQEDIQKAMDQIDNVLTNTFSRVTISMDVSYTEHPYIIRKGGAGFDWLKKETGCSIRFPGLQTSDTSQKINQVDIIGDIVGAEQARSYVRNMMPLIFSFELPNDYNPYILNMYAPNVYQLQNQYNVEVSWHVEPNLQPMFVTVRGSEEEAVRVKQATCLLMEMMFGDFANQIPIQTCMAFSPQYRETVIGKEHVNLKSIMKNTHTQITFPHARHRLTDSTVVISGSIDNVYFAKQQLMGLLPLWVVFELPNECILIPEKVVTIQSDLHVDIMIGHHTKTYCYIAGMEQYARNIYEARNRILGINIPNTVACIPVPYFIPFVGTTTEVTTRYSPMAESSSTMVSSKRSQEESYPSVSNTCTCTMSNSVKSPLAIPSSSNQANTFKHSTVSGVAGIREMQNKQEEAYRLRTSAGSGYGFRYENFGGLLLYDQEKIWTHKEDQPSNNLPYYQSKRYEDQQSFTTHFDEVRVAEIRAMQDMQAQAYRVSPSKESDYGVNYNNRNEHQQSFRTAHCDQTRVEEIPVVQNIQENSNPPSSSSGSGHKANYTTLGDQQLSDEKELIEKTKKDF